MYDNDNIFAKIIKGQIPCKKVYEDEESPRSSSVGSPGFAAKFNGNL